jgi:hypothetical protein
MPVKPSVDYLYGRQVESVGRNEKAEGDWDWYIKFEGGSIIRNHDKRRKALPKITGLVLLAALYSELDTRLVFGHHDQVDGSVTDEEITLTPTAYSISDSRFPGGPHFPQRLDPEEESLLPADPSGERVAEGPEVLLEGTESAAEGANGKG